MQPQHNNAKEANPNNMESITKAKQINMEIHPQQRFHLFDSI